jgi:hypothetical protein
MDDVFDSHRAEVERLLDLALLPRLTPGDQDQLRVAVELWIRKGQPPTETVPGLVERDPDHIAVRLIDSLKAASDEVPNRVTELEALIFARLPDSY